jgi:hypothetical protein
MQKAVGRRSEAAQTKMEDPILKTTKGNKTKQKILWGSEGMRRSKITYLWTEKASQHSNDPHTVVQDQNKCLQSVKGHRRVMNTKCTEVTVTSY